jgi:two-component system phosphate regulon sensor histidine kinase PhoR
MEVADTGIGIGSEDITKLFQFFGKLDHSKNVNKGGMGLGLTISRMIIR